MNSGKYLEFPLKCTASGGLQTWESLGERCDGETKLMSSPHCDRQGCPPAARGLSRPDRHPPASGEGVGLAVMWERHSAPGQEEPWVQVDTWTDA